MEVQVGSWWPSGPMPKEVSLQQGPPALLQSAVPGEPGSPAFVWELACFPLWQVLGSSMDTSKSCKGQDAQAYPSPLGTAGHGDGFRCWEEVQDLGLLQPPNPAFPPGCPRGGLTRLTHQDGHRQSGTVLLPPPVRGTQPPPCLTTLHGARTPGWPMHDTDRAEIPQTFQSDSQRSQSLHKFTPHGYSHSV